MREIPLEGGWNCDFMTQESWPQQHHESLTSGVDQSGPRQRLHHSGYRRGEGCLAYTFHQQGKGWTGPEG